MRIEDGGGVIPSLCPKCGIALVEFAAVDGGDDVPRPGDLTICSACDAILIFDAHQRVRVPLPEETAVTRRVIQSQAIRRKFLN